MEKIEITDFKNNFLVDVPVRINVWIRPNSQRKQFEVIKKARPSILFLVSDGPRNERERNLINESRLIVEDIDWNCKVYKIYNEQNIGLYEMARKGRDFIYEHVDRVIYLEDDHIPSVSFFKFCAELLEKYKDDKRIAGIGGMNYLGNYKDPKSDYFFTSFRSIWGTASWKRTVYADDVDLSLLNNSYEKKIFKKSCVVNQKKYFAKNLLSGKMSKTYLANGEFKSQFKQLTEHQLFIVPTMNMISNVGAVEDSANADNIKNLPRGIRRVFNMKTYECEFPLKHPRYVMNDVFYTKKARRIMGFGHPIVNFYRKIERTFLMMIHGDFRKVVYKIKKRRV